MNLLELTQDSSFPTDSINDSSILIIKEEISQTIPEKLNRSISSSSSSLKRKETPILSGNLDLTRISNRILVTSRCWSNGGNGGNGKVNKTEELAGFLNNKYKEKYLLWNIGTPESLVSPSEFDNRVIPAVLPKSQSPTLKSLFHLCHSISGWLGLSLENVVILQCVDGWNRSGLLTSCLLKFLNQMDSTFEALNLFQSRRLKTKNGNVNFIEFSKLNLRYLKYFNDICNQNGRVPNPSSLCLHQMIISTIPNFDGSGNCSPGVEIFQNNELILSSCLISDKSSLNSKVYIFKDDYNIIFKFKENFLERDIQLHIFHSNPKTGQRSTILSFTFNTAFFHPGVIRLRPEDLEMPLKNTEVPGLTFPDSSKMKSGQKRFKEDFCVDLIILPSEGDKFIDYSSTVRNNLAKNLLRLSQLHPIRPDRKLLPPLLLRSFPKFYSKLALQIYFNDIHRAHEYLEKLRKEEGIKDLEKSFMELTIIKEEKLEIDEICRKTEHLKANNETELLDTNENTGTLKSAEKKIASDIKMPIDELIITSNTPIKDTGIESITTITTAAAGATSQYIIAKNIKDDIDLSNHEKKTAPLPSFSGIGIKSDESNIPPPPPLPATRLYPLPPPSPVSNINLTALIPPPPPPPPLPAEKPRIKNTLHWNEIQLTDDSSSIWHEIAKNDIDLELNSKKFEELFCIDLRHEKKTSLSSKTENLADIPVIIDIRRANNIGIGLSRFQRRFEGFEDLLKAIYGDSMDLDDFLTLKTILPFEDEIKNLRLIKKSDKILLERMGKAEQFLYLVANQKPYNLPQIINYKIFELTCWQDFEGLKEKFLSIQQVLDALKSSDELKIILKVTLDLGNLATYEYGRYGNRRNSASGFTLDSLCKLHEVKSVNGQSNLLIFLIASLAQSQPQVLELTKREEFRELELIKSWSDRELIQELRELKDKSQKISQEISQYLDQEKEHSQQDEFWKDSIEKVNKFIIQLNTLDQLMISFKTTWITTSSYFGIDPAGGVDVSEFLTNIWQFFKNFESAVKQVKKNKSESESESHDTLKSSSSSISSDTIY